jgi:hypothetical protein
LISVELTNRMASKKDSEAKVSSSHIGSPKDIESKGSLIEEKFRKMTEENDRKWKKFLKSLEKMEDVRESFLERVTDYKARTELCVEIMNKGNSLKRWTPRPEDKLSYLENIKGSYMNLYQPEPDNKQSLNFVSHDPYFKLDVNQLEYRPSDDSKNGITPIRGHHLDQRFRKRSDGKEQGPKEPSSIGLNPVSFSGLQTKSLKSEESMPVSGQSIPPATLAPSSPQRCQPHRRRKSPSPIKEISKPKSVGENKRIEAAREEENRNHGSPSNAESRFVESEEIKNIPNSDLNPQEASQEEGEQTRPPTFQAIVDELEAKEQNQCPRTPPVEEVQNVYEMDEQASRSGEAHSKEKSKLLIHSHTSKDIFIDGSEKERRGLEKGSAVEIPGFRDKRDPTILDQFFIGDEPKSEIGIVDGQSANNEAIKENEEEVLFSSTQEKADIITSFILENLIIESISEDFCCPKFIQILGPHLRMLEFTAISSYLKHLYEMVNRDPTQQHSILNKLNKKVGHTDIQRLLLSSPLLTEKDLESLGGFEYEPVLDIKLYIQLEEQFRETEYTEKHYDNFEMEKEHILHKMIFDSLNENLDYKRRFGVNSSAPDFFVQNKEVEEIKAEKCATILEEARKEVLQWSMLKNGTLIEKEPQISYNSDLKNLEVMRETGIQSLLKDYVIEV